MGFDEIAVDIDIIYFSAKVDIWIDSEKLGMQEPLGSRNLGFLSPSLQVSANSFGVSVVAIGML